MKGARVNRKPKLYIEITRNYDWLHPEFVNRYVRQNMDVQFLYGNDVNLLSRAMRNDMFRDCDIAVSCVVPVTAEMMDLSPRLKLICGFGAGYDQIDVEAATRRGIPVINGRGCNRTAVAELIVGMMIMLSRNLLAVTKSMQNNIWYTSIGREIHGRTLGIIGMGNVGCELARICKNAFNMNVLVNDIHINEEAREKYGVKYTDLETLFLESDYISINVPYSTSTVRLVNRERLNMMKRDAFIINTSRGGVLDERALYNAIKNGRIAGAGLDVFEQEPYEKNIFAEFPNVITTTHCGGNTPESIKHIGDTLGREIELVLSGKNPENNIVNPEVFDNPLWLERLHFDR